MSIVKRAAVDYPHLKVVTYSSPYKPEFSDEDNKAIIDAINAANPDLLWIGMTAPKQEKWTYSHWNELNIHCHVDTIGAVFDFFAGTVERAPIWWQDHGLEWLYRLIKEPKRMWSRYIRCSKIIPSFFTIKEGSTFLTKPLFPQGREDVTALRCPEPLRYMVGGPKRSSPCYAGWDRLGWA